MNDKNVRAEIMMILSRHVGKEKAIGMGELFNRVYDRPWRNHNDMKPLRDEIKALRYAGVLIGESRSSTGGGYYLARSVSELNEWMSRRKVEALKKLGMLAAMMRISLPELLGQMQMNFMTGKSNGDTKEREQPADPDRDSAETPGGIESSGGDAAPGDTLHLFS